MDKDVTQGLKKVCNDTAKDDVKTNFKKLKEYKVGEMPAVFSFLVSVCLFVCLVGWLVGWLLFLVAGGQTTGRLRGDAGSHQAVGFFGCRIGVVGLEMLGTFTGNIRKPCILDDLYQQIWVFPVK